MAAAWRRRRAPSWRRQRRARLQPNRARRRRASAPRCTSDSRRSGLTKSGVEDASSTGAIDEIKSREQCASSRFRPRFQEAFRGVIILDTNVVSELDRPDRAASRASSAWLDQPSHEAILGSTTIHHVLEIAAPASSKLLAEPTGRRKRALLAAFDALVIGDFDNRVLPFDLPAAIHAAQIDIDSASGAVVRLASRTPRSPASP